jgi:hypothetical protein
MADIDYEKAFESLMTQLSGPSKIRDMYQFCGNPNLKKAIKKWWNARYRKPLKDD